jgi:hypothetical protein
MHYKSLPDPRYGLSAEYTLDPANLHLYVANYKREAGKDAISSVEMLYCAPIPNPFQK